MNIIPKRLFLEVAFLCLIALGWLLAYRYMELPFTSDYFIDAILIFGLVMTLIFRTDHPRHFWVAYGFIILSAFTTLFSVDSLTYIFSALAVGFLLLGVVNLVLFGLILKKKDIVGRVEHKKKQSKKSKK